MIALLAAAYRSLSSGVRITSILIGGAGITFHASHLPVGLGVTALAAAWLLWGSRGRIPVPWGQWVALAGPVLLGAALTVGLNSVAFGGPSLTGQALSADARPVVAEGPAKWYLDKNCGSLKYAICGVDPRRSWDDQ